MRKPNPIVKYQETWEQLCEIISFRFFTFQHSANRSLLPKLKSFSLFLGLGNKLAGRYVPIVFQKRYLGLHLANGVGIVHLISGQIIQPRALGQANLIPTRLTEETVSIIF